MLLAAEQGFGPPWEWAGGSSLIWLIRRNELSRIQAEHVARQ